MSVFLFWIHSTCTYIWHERLYFIVILCSNQTAFINWGIKNQIYKNSIFVLWLTVRYKYKYAITVQLMLSILQSVFDMNSPWDQEWDLFSAAPELPALSHSCYAQKFVGSSHKQTDSFVQNGFGSLYHLQTIIIVPER